MAIHKQSDDKILLHQPPTTLSQVESWTTFEIKEPDYIDVEFSFTIHDSDFFKNGYAGFFWASYINQPEDIGIHFKDRKSVVEGKSVDLDGCRSDMEVTK